MTDFDESSLQETLEQLLAAPSVDAQDLIELHDEATSGGLRDLTLTANHYGSMFSWLLRMLRCEDDRVVAPAAVRAAHEIVTAAFAYPEFNADSDLNAHIGHAIVPEAVDTILKRLVRTSVGSMQRESAKRDTLGLVTMVTAKDPTSNALDAATIGQKSGTRSRAGRDSGHRAGTGRRTQPFLPTLQHDEMAHLRALLFWLCIQFPARCSIVMERCESFLHSYGASPSAEAASAVGVVLSLILATLRGEAAELQRRDQVRSQEQGAHTSSAAVTPPPLGYLSSPASTRRVLHLLLPLHEVSGMVSDTSSSLSLYHEPLVQCIAIAIAHAPLQLLPTIQSLLRSWRDGCRAVGNTAKGLLLLHEIDTLVRDQAARDVAAADDEAADDAQEPASASAVTRPVRNSPLTTVLPLVVSAIEECIGSENSREAQVALSFFKQRVVAAHVASSPRLAASVLAALHRGGKPHWNGTVNRMTAAAFKAILAADDGRGTVAAAVEQVFGDGIGTYSHISASASRSSNTASIGLTGSAALVEQGMQIRHLQQQQRRQQQQQQQQQQFGGFGSDFQHAGISSGGSRSQPPVTITGVAPWATGLSSASQPSTLPRRSPAANPPVTITGVAPWATQHGGGLPVLMPPPASRPAPRLPVLQQHNVPEAAAQPVPAVSSSGGDGRDAEASRGMARLQAYLLQLVPPPAPRHDVLDAAAESTAAGPQCGLSPAPVLLPSLAFHDLVFGRELGRGSFSTVKYTKHIRKGVPASQWTEYAVKIISTPTIQALGYEGSVRREMAVLSVLTHPNIARLVSAFRWREGAYLVIEYAGRGDLQSTLASIGSLDEPTAQFLMAEVAAALHHIHSKGFAYGDCKPENIVLAEGSSAASAPVDAYSGDASSGSSGGVHAKLTDMAACRPITDAGRAIVAASGNIIRNLRDGDWRAQMGLKNDTTAAAGSNDGAGCSSDTGAAAAADSDDAGVVDESSADDRIEGTEAYLSPELASHTSLPSIASDAYAFGVTLYQCLTGRLPDVDSIWPPGDPDASNGEGPDASSSASRHVRFGAGRSKRGHQEGPFPPDFPEPAKDLVRSLLHPDPSRRLGGGPAGFLDVMSHPWFAAAIGTPDDIINNLYSRPAPGVVAGTAGPPPDPAWSRRHNSTIWAPLPKSYNTFSSSDGKPSNDVSDASANAGGARAPRAASSFTLLDLVRLSVDALPAIPPPVALATPASRA